MNKPLYRAYAIYKSLCSLIFCFMLFCAQHNVDFFYYTRSRLKMSSVYRTIDYYTRAARSAGYPSRAVFKLAEIDDKFRILKPAYRILDLGCAPGSWSMYAAQRVGLRGHVYGVDLAEIKEVMPPNSSFVQNDAFTWQVPSKLQSRVNVLLSDMAPNTTGNTSHDAAESVELCRIAMNIAAKSLKPHGTVVLKIFQGAEFPSFLKSLRTLFTEVNVFKPQSSRSESVETFIIGRRYQDIATKDENNKSLFSNSELKPQTSFLPYQRAVTHHQPTIRTFATSNQHYLRIGDKFTACKSFSASDVHTFAVVSGDHNPMHMKSPLLQDDHAQLFNGQPIVHGMLVASLIGAIFATNMPNSVYLSQRLAFKNPVYFDEQVKGTIEVLSVRKSRLGDIVNCHTVICKVSSGETVIDGDATVLVQSK